MHRTQISIEDEQYAYLVGEARRAGVSIAELLRRMIAAQIREQAGTGDPLDDLAGIAGGDGAAAGREHDRYLYDERPST